MSQTDVQDIQETEETNPVAILMEELRTFELHAYGGRIFVEEQDSTIGKNATPYRKVSFYLPRGYKPDGKLDNKKINQKVWTTTDKGRQLAATLATYNGHDVVVYLRDEDVTCNVWEKSATETIVTFETKNSYIIPTLTTIIEVQQDAERKAIEEAEAAKNAPAFDAPPYDEKDMPF